MPNTTPTAILTRPAGRSDALVRALCEKGWRVIECPALAIRAAPVESWFTLPRPAEFDMVVFVSGAAVAGYARQLGKGVEWPLTTLVAAVGPATARAARAAFGAEIATLYPASAQAQDSEALWDVIVRQPSLPRSVLIVRGQVGREWLGEQMRARGIEVQAHIAYEREVAVWPTETVRTLRDWAAQGVRPVWLLTSAEGIAATLDQAQANDLTGWCRESAFVVTHPRLTRVLQQRLGEGAHTPLISTALPEDDAVLLCFEQIREHASLC